MKKMDEERDKKFNQIPSLEELQHQVSELRLGRLGRDSKPSRRAYPSMPH